MGAPPLVCPTQRPSTTTRPIPSSPSFTTRQGGSIRLVSVVLEPKSPSYARWHDMVLLMLRRYALDDHVLTDPTTAVKTASWLRLDSIVLSWILETVSPDLHDLVRTSPNTRRAWLALEGQFLGNAETRALRFDASFRTFVQGDLSASEFCRRMKSMADSLGDLGWPVEDRIVVLNVLRGLSDRYTHLRTWIAGQRPFPSFLQVNDDLVMEELTQGPQPVSTSTPGSLTPRSSTSSTALAATPPRLSAPSPSSLLGTPSPKPSEGGGDVAAVVGAGGGAWEQSGSTAPTGCVLAHLPQPVVEAHLHVALPGFGGDPHSPAAMFAGASPGFHPASPWTPTSPVWPPPTGASPGPTNWS